MKLAVYAARNLEHFGVVRYKNEIIWRKMDGHLNWCSMIGICCEKLRDNR
jgi:hypothetical protein